MAELCIATVCVIEKVSFKITNRYDRILFICLMIGPCVKLRYVTLLSANVNRKTVDSNGI